MSDDLVYLEARIELEAQELGGAPRRAIEKIVDVVAELRRRNEGHDVDPTAVRRVIVDLDERGLEQVRGALGKIRDGCSKLGRSTAAEVANEIAAHVDDAVIDRRELDRRLRGS